MACPPLAIYEELRAALEPVAPCFLGARFLAQHDVPRRYVWVFTGEDSAAAGRVGGNPRTHHTDRWNVEVHCWGADFEEAYRLRQVLITRLRGLVAGANYAVGRTAIFSDAENMALGSTFVVALTLNTPLADATTTEDRPAAIADDVRPRVRPIRVEFDLGEVRASGSSPPNIILAGRTATPIRGRIQIEAAGMLGTARFRYSFDDGETWEGTGLPTAPDVPLGAGLTVHFESGDYRADNVYRFTNTPAQSEDGTLSVLET